ncbi:MAG TPA: hypothetical protein VHS99_10850 [Chloroflexota bacterium]|nr:hypothetical protein [Chloroflexota bacterium]
MHQVPVAADLRNPWLEDALVPGGPRRNAYHPPPEQYRDLLEAVEAVPGPDRGVLRELGAFMAERLEAFPPGSESPDPWGHVLALLAAGDRWSWR